MTKKIALVFCLLPLFFTSNAQLKGAFKKFKNKLTERNLSQEEVGMGLKEALNKGVEEAVNNLSAVDGYYKSPYKILVPEEAQKVTDKLKFVPGFSNVEKKLVEKMNRAAELAAAKAKPIFVRAIKQMTFTDAMNILMGQPDAATRYLERTTSDSLFAEFKPVIQTSLDEVHAREYWRSAVTAYNKIPLVSKTNPELDEHVTKMALVGLFSLVEKKELAIRENTGERTSDLLRKVFAKQDKNRD